MTLQRNNNGTHHIAMETIPCTRVRLYILDKINDYCSNDSYRRDLLKHT